MPSVDALPVKVPFPRHEPSALFAELPSQHRVTKIRKYLVGIFQTGDLQRGRTFKDPHILLDLCGSLRDRPKLPVYFRPRNIRWSETDDAVSVNRAERLFVPTDVDQTVFQQPYVQFLSQELVFYLLIGRILYRSGNFDAYPRFADELKNLAFALAQVRKQADAKCLKYAQDYCKEPYNIWIGSGDLWPTAYSYSMCVLEESQWIRTKSVSSPEFFHGTLELVEKDTSLILFYGEDETRPLMDRVLKFSKTVSDEITIFDTKEVELPFTDPEFRKIVSPIVIYAITERLSAHLAKERNHPLTTRRYYRQMEY